MEAIVSEVPPQITLKIYSAPTAASGHNPNIAGTYDVFRKTPEATSWGAPMATITLGTDVFSWTDTNVSVGQVYEYGLAATGTTAFKFGNVLAGIKADRTQPRGRVAVVVATDIATNLATEYAQFKSDLVADGWVVHEIPVARAKDYLSNGTGANDVNGVPTAPFPTAHIDIRNQIIALNSAYPGELKNVILLGKVPVARSGISGVGPDGHGNRAALGADAFYADTDGVWTDTQSNLSALNVQFSGVTVALGTINVPGDNKFDPEYMSELTPNAAVELGFGRIDLSHNVPGEYAAMRMYLDKLHRYKTASADFLPGRKAIMRGSFGMVTQAFLAGLPGVVGMSNLDYIKTTDLPTVPNLNYDTDSEYTAQTAPYLFYFKGSGGPDYSEGGRAVFWTGMQSHWGYWFEPAVTSGQNRMQRRLAEDNYCLSFTWSIGLGYLDTCYLYHRMGMGFDAGDMMRASISNRRSATSLHVPADSPLFMNHMGDPTLRLFMFPPPTNLSVVPAGGNASLSWTAAQAPAAGEPQVIGYHVYRSSSAAGPFARITSSPVAGTTYLDTTVASGAWHYCVKAVRLETTGGGTFYNASLGAMQFIDLTNGPAALAVTTTSLPDANWSTPYRASLTASGGTPVFTWAVIAGALPPGLTLLPEGVITGSATAAGAFSFTARVTDQLGQTAQTALTVTAQSNQITTVLAEAGQYMTGYNTTKWAFYEPSLLLSGPVYLYQPFLRFDLTGLDTRNGLVRARLILTLDERSQVNSYALVKAALTQDAGDGWDESVVTYATRPLDDSTLAPVSATNTALPYATLEFDVTPLVQTTLANDPAKKLGLRLFTNFASAFGNEIRIATRFASGDARPRLIIETTDAPAITITSPTAGGAAIHAGSSLWLSATVTAIPANAGTLSVQWTRLSGPGTVVISSPSTPATAVRFSAAGDHILRLTAQDGVLSSYKDVAVRVLAVPAGTAPVSGPVDPALIVRLPFDETSGASAADVSGVSPSNNGTLATIGATGNPTWVSGRIGGALNFDGAGQRVEIADSATTPLDGMQKLTASLWVKLNAADTNSHALLVKRTTSSTSTTSYAITLTNAEKISVSVANKTAVVGDTILNAGQWYHIVMIYDGALATNNLQLHVNGLPEKFGTIVTGQADNIIPRITGSKLRIGDYAPTATVASLNGQVDEVRLYNRVLTTAEIQDLATAAPANIGPVITAPPTAIGTAGQAFALNATVTDDGMPGPLTLAWAQYSGPGSLVFTSPAASSTSATAALAGVFTARFSANDGAVTTLADVIATISGGSAYQAWLQENGLPADGSGNGAATANPSGDGVVNGMKFALGLPVSSVAYAGRLTTGTHEVGDEKFLSLTFSRPEPAPAGVVYQVTVSGDLTNWTTAGTLEVANAVGGGLRTITVRDGTPLNGVPANRFIRLEVMVP